MESTLRDIDNSALASCSSIDPADEKDRELQIQQDALLALRLAEEQDGHNERDCASDVALALMLQRQFDVEYNKDLEREEARLNGQSKVGISLNRFKRVARCNCPDLHEHLSDCDQYFSDEYDLDDARDDSRETIGDVFEQSELRMKSRMLGRCGFVIDQDGKMITKHDIPTSSRKNMCRLMESKTDVQTGDAGDKKDDFKINNYVYNNLKVHLNRNSRRTSQKFFDKNQRIRNASLDQVQASCKMNDATCAILSGFFSNDKIEKLDRVIGHGKESTIFLATGRDHENQPGQEVAVKIFDIDKSFAFKTRDSYNKSKFPSYKFDKPKSKSDSLNKWAERGFKNLRLLRKANINCPEAIWLKKNVMVMTFIGKNSSPSPILKDAQLTQDQLRSSYDQVISMMERMYKDCDLIHGDLSEYNLLWHDDQVYLIDVSQSMFSDHPNANGFLYRDCRNILNFYEKSGLTEILDRKSLFKTICGKDISNKDLELWSKMEDFPSNEILMQKDKRSNDGNDHFTEMFDSSNKSLAS